MGIDADIKTGECNIIAVGDSNFFLFRNNEMKVSFPVQKAAEFGNTPFLISSEAHKNKIKNKLFSEETFQINAGDILILGTDAISHWILNEAETGNNPVNILYEMLTSENKNFLFESWLSDHRNNHNSKK